MTNGKVYSTADLMGSLFDLIPDGASKVSAGAWASTYYARDGRLEEAVKVKEEISRVIDRLRDRRVSNG